MLRPTNRSFRVSKTAKTTDKVAVYGRNPSDQRLVSLFRLSQTLTAADPSGVMPSVFKGEFSTLEEARAAMIDTGDYAIIYNAEYKTGVIEMKARNGSFVVVEVFSDENYFPMNKIGYIFTTEAPAQQRAVCNVYRPDLEFAEDSYYSPGLGAVADAMPVIILSAYNNGGVQSTGPVFIIGLDGAGIFYDNVLNMTMSESVFSLTTMDASQQTIKHIPETNTFSLYDGTTFNFFFSTKKAPVDLNDSNQ